MRSTILRRPMRPFIAIVLSLTVVLVAAVAVAVRPGGDARTPADRFFDGLRLDGLEPPAFATLGAMAAGSDSVVVGRITAFRLGRVVQGDSAEDTVAYGEATVAVTEQVRGRALDGTVPVEFLLLGTDVNGLTAELAASLPDGDLLLFLHEKRARGEAGRYRLVHSHGLITASGDSVVAALAAEAPSFRSELKGVTSVHALADRLRTG